MNIKSCIGQTLGSWGLLMCEYGRKSMIICEKKYWLPKADRSLKLLTNFIIIGEILSVKDILTFISLLITYMFVSPKYFA